MKVQRISERARQKNERGNVKMTTCGNIVEVVEMARVNKRGTSIIPLGGDAYVKMKDFDFRTGEITGDGVQYYKRTENRGENKSGIAASMKAVRDLINCNVTDPSHARWLTLTYAENMTDAKRLYIDRKNFWKRVLRWHKSRGYPTPEYISVVEPQGRGAWHLHELWLYPDKAPYLPNDDVRELWEQGFVTVKRLDDVDNVGAYLTAYLCDVPLDEAEKAGLNIAGCELKTAEITQEDGTKIPKKYVKGARLNLYPNKMNFYRTSRGVKRPEVVWTSGEKAKEKVSAATLTFSKTIRLSSDDFTNDIHYEYYNLVRGKSQD